MSESSEYKLAESLVWSKQDFSLAEFVKAYELPQVILVEVGYCGVNERTTFSSGQILTLHLLRTTSKIVCEVPHSKAVMVPTACELKAEVIPMECNDTIVTAHQLSTHYRKIKYIRVMELGSTSNNNNLHSLKPNDILQIKKIEHSNRVIRCKNLTTEQTIDIPIDSTSVFVPLVEPKTYTLAEIQKNFGLPAKLRFLDRSAEMKMRSVPGHEYRPPTMLLSGLGQITAMEEIKDSDVIVTTVCSNLDEKMCLSVPTKLDIRVTVAEGFLKGDETYQKIVKTLDKEFKRTDLKNFEDLDVREHEVAVKQAIQGLSRRLSIEEASPDVAHHAREHSSNKRTSAKKKPILSFEKKPPPLVPRSAPKAISPPPAIPPKPRPKTAQKPDQKTTKFGQILKGIKSPEWLGRKQNASLERKQSATKSPSSSEGNEFVCEEPLDKSEGLYASVDEIYQEPGSSSDEDSEYTELNADYTPATPRPYETLKTSQTHRKVDQAPPLPNTGPPMTRQERQSNYTAIENPQPHGKIYEQPDYEKPFENPPTKLTPHTPPPLPSTAPPKSQEERQAIYEAIAKFPQDLSGLSVADVSRLLRYLSMTPYVETFENELVDGSMLASMDQESLESLNMKNFHVKKLLRFIDGWRPNV